MDFKKTNTLVRGYILILCMSGTGGGVGWSGVGGSPV